jgi:hypothetical protein
MMRKLGSQDPGNTQFQADVASMQTSLGEALLAEREARAGVEVLAAAVASFAALPAGLREDNYVHYHQGLAHHLLGVALQARQQAGDAAAACTQQRLALPIIEEMDKQGIPPGLTGPAAVREALKGCG